MAAMYQVYAPAALYTAETFLLLLVCISVTGSVNLQGLMRLEGLGELEIKSWTLSRLEPANSHLVE
jgi:hypothetical protein